jgi:hypothetical protein
MLLIVIKHEYSTAALRDGLGLFRVEAIGFAGSAIYPRQPEESESP